jgi:hypothetical protein
MAYKPKNRSKFYFYVDPKAAWECIENGKDVSTLYPDYFNEEITGAKHSAHMESILMLNEQYMLLEGTMYDYALTSLGRVINCIYGTQCYVYFRKDNVMITMRDSRLGIKEAFEGQGWHFSVNELLDNYTKYKWKHKTWKS